MNGCTDKLKTKDVNHVFVLAVKHGTGDTPAAGFWRMHGSSPNQSTCVFLWASSSVKLVL